MLEGFYEREKEREVLFFCIPSTLRHYLDERLMLILSSPEEKDFTWTWARKLEHMLE